MFKKLFNTCILVALCSVLAQAQEFNCKVSIYHDKITGVDAAVFTSMQKAISDFINTHKWTNDDFGTAEKIDCNILISLLTNNVNGDPDAYSATFSIQASRPVYNSAYTSPLINYVDKDMIFHFSQFNTLRFDDNQVAGSDAVTANLTAIIAYYSYLVLGLDYDSFSPEGGTNMLKKAQNVVNNAPDSKGITGWKPVESTHNRYWITDDLLNTRFHDVRSYWYTMHREGLDSMYTKPTEARTRMLVGLKKVYNVSKENPSSMLITFFFDAKATEIQHILAQAPKQDRNQFVTILDAMDVPNAGKYNTLR